MRRHSIVSGILLILPIVDFAVAAPVPVQEIHRAGVDVVHIPEEANTVLEKRGDLLDKFITNLGHFAKPPRVSSAPHLRPPPPPPPALPGAGPSTESSYESMVVHAPLSAHVFPTWFHPDHANYGLMGTHASVPKSGPSNPSTKPDSGQTLLVEEPPSPPRGSSTTSGLVRPPEMAPGPPSS